jgi:hypothetical protein
VYVLPEYFRSEVKILDAFPWVQINYTFSVHEIAAM